MLIKFKGIQTNNFKLENLKISDVKSNYLLWLRNKKVNKFITKSNFKDLEQLKKFIKKNYLKKNSFFLKILNKNKLHIGNVRIYNINLKKSSAYFGILIGDQKSWNKGLTQEVIQHIGKYLYKQFKIVKIYLGIDKKNISALQAYNKSGFVFVNKNKNLMCRNYFLNKLCIGTAQFGSNYGIANKNGIVKISEIKKIKKFALSNGIRTMDTAQAYGEGEKRLSKIGINEFTTLSKLPVTKPGTNRKKWVLDNIKKSLKILNKKFFHAVFVHNTNYLYDKKGREIYKGLVIAQNKGLVKNIGVSTYTIEEIKFIIKNFKKFNIIMLPYNIIDRRPIKSKIFKKLNTLNIEVHTRSVFLQGLLLLNNKKVPKKFHKWSNVFSSIEKVSKKLGLSKYEVCLRYVLSNPLIDKVLIGTDNFSQLKKLVNISKKGNLNIKNKDIYPSYDTNLLNPSKWPGLV